MPIPLSVLDISPIPSGGNAGDALRSSIELARFVEGLGYRRFWLAEHHNAGSLASSAPEIMIGQIAAATSTLRVGAGGIMLPNHAPLKVAELFRVLSALFPQRIDLGLGRAAGTDPRTAAALRRFGAATSSDDFPEMMRALLEYLEDAPAASAPSTRPIRAIPTGVPSPRLFVLGSSDYGATFAAEHGFPFAFAHHLNPMEAVAVTGLYRRAFQPSKHGRAPHLILAVAALCAEDEEAARDLALASDLAALHFAQGLRHLPFPSVDEARAHLWSEDDRAFADAFRPRSLVGTANDIVGELRDLVDRCGADELMVMTNTHDQETRRRSYALLAERMMGG